jgi:hypothetical protein
VDRTTSSGYATVDRYEAIWAASRPGSASKQSRWKLKEVLLFTALDEQQFVLKNSIGFGGEVRISRPGDTVIREGLLITGQAFGGYPVIQE